METVKYTQITQPRRHYTEDERREIIKDYYKSGIGYKRFAAMNNVSKTALSNWIRRIGVEVREEMEKESIENEKIAKYNSAINNKSIVQVSLQEYLELKETSHKFDIMRSIMNA